MLIFFLFVSIFLCCLSYVSVDPIKGGFYLVFSIIMFLPLFSYSIHVWYSYYICLLFLSGVFVLIVYFSSVVDCSSSFRNSWAFIFLFFCFCFYYSCFYYDFSDFDCIDAIVDGEHLCIYVIVVSVLFLFLNFVSYFLNFSGALRNL